MAVDLSRDSSLSFGPFRLDPVTESVWRDAEEIRLRPKTFAVLKHLADRPRRLVTKEELLTAVWPGVVVGDAALTVCVGEIRKFLGDDAQAPRFIETVHRRGYRFIGSAPPAGSDGAPPVALVGRETELRGLRAQLQRALTGERQLVFVTGEPGIGKTALVEAFIAGIAGCWVTRGQCLDHYGAGEAYLPILEALGRLAREPGAGHVRTVLRQHAPTWLLQMPGLIGADDLAALEPRTAGTTRERMLREMADALDALAAERPLVLLLEDLHWSDHSTLDLLAAVARRREPARLLLIGTYRPAEVIVRGHPLGAVKQELALHAAGQELPLELLGEDEVEHCLAPRFGEDVARRLAATIHARTDGLPLFVVAVVDALIDQQLLVRSGEGWRFTGDGAAVETAVPQGLREMIEQQLARLDADEQRLLEAASVPGMIFAAASAAAALEAGVESIESRCQALARREQFIAPAGVEDWPDGTVSARYRFRHVLYQQVLYERLPAARCASLHRRIGEREEAAYRSRPGEHAAAMALHFERGRDMQRAVQYRRIAAEQALRRCAYLEATDHLARGRELLAAIPDEAARPVVELGLQMALGPALIALRGSAAHEAEAAYLRARELAENLGDLQRLRPALWGLCFVNYSQGRYAQALALGERLLALAERGDDAAWVLEGHHVLWSVLIAMGESAAAVAHIEAGHRLWEPACHASESLTQGHHDAVACSWYQLATARWALGYPDAALAAVGQAEARVRRLNHPMTTMISLCTMMWVHHNRGDVAAARRCATEAVALGTSYGFAGWVDDGAVLLACTGDAPQASIRELYERVGRGSAGRGVLRNTLCLCMLARFAAERRDFDTAWEIMQAVPDQHRGSFFAPEIERLRGELFTVKQPSEAEQCFRRAIGIARSRSERSLELRAATSLAQLLARSGRREEGGKMLREIYAWFTEGFDTADLKAAREVLDRLTT
jgi:DNA-binding winged helix-turn-helix (wHTH) protein/tetratricopeptide (TPR) repeat protein